MKLLYLYVNESGHDKVLSASLCSEFKFSFNREGGKLIVHKGKSDIPNRFFSTDGMSSCVSNISAFVGGNASGKTSVARYLQQIRSNKDCSTRFDYILVYEKDSVWRIQSYFVDDEMEGHRRDVEIAFEDGLPQKTIARDHAKNHALCDFEYIYYSPHFTTESPFPMSCLEMENMSTAGIMYGGFEDSMGRPVDHNDNIAMNRNYIAIEHRMGLAALRDIPTREEGGIDLPEPRCVSINIHYVEFDENVKWLRLQRRNIEAYIQAVADKKAKQDLPIETAQRFIRDIDDLLEFSNIVYGSEVDVHYDFVLRSFVAFTLSYVRLSDYFARSFNPLYVWYAQCLLEICRREIRPFIGADNPDREALYRNLVHNLKHAVVLSSKKPGSISEPREIHTERKALVRAFIQIAKLSYKQVAENNGKSMFRLMADKDEKRLIRLIDNYFLGMQRFDFLSFGYEPVMSSGEMARLSMYGRLNDCIKMFNESRAIKEFAVRNGRINDLPNKLQARGYSRDLLVFLDEAETTLHPAEQRKVVRNIIKLFELIASTYSIHIIFATHSPILLSDIPIGNVTFLNEENNIDLYGLKDTFGANVFDLYRLPFALKEGMVGEFAQNKLDDVVVKAKRIIKGEKSCVISCDEWKAAELVGDPFAAKYFESIKPLVERAQGSKL